MTIPAPYTGVQGALQSATKGDIPNSMAWGRTGMKTFLFLLGLVVISACSPGAPGNDQDQSAGAAVSPAAEAPRTSAQEVERASAPASAAPLASPDAVSLTSTGVCPLAPTCEDIFDCYEQTDCLDATDLRAREALAFLQSTEVYRGRAVAPEDYGETVLIMPPGPLSAGAALCTGVLLSPQIVVSAAHCETDPLREGSNIYFGSSAVDAFFTTTVSELKKADNGADLVLLRLTDKAPESITPAAIASRADIALSRPPLNRSRIAREADVRAAKGARVVGFGLTDQGISGVKMRTDVGVVSAFCDQQEVPVANGAVYSDTELFGCRPGLEAVAGAARGRPGTYSDTCGGDSGGPFFVVPAEKAGRTDYFATIPTEYYLAGVTKQAINTRYIRPGPYPYCGNGGIYTLLVGENLAWVQRTASQWGEQVVVR